MARSSMMAGMVAQIRITVFSGTTEGAAAPRDRLSEKAGLVVVALNSSYIPDFLIRSLSSCASRNCAQVVR